MSDTAATASKRPVQTSTNNRQARKARRISLLCLGFFIIPAGFAGLDRWIYEHIAVSLNTPSPADSDFYHLTLPIWDSIRFFPHIVGGAAASVAILTLRRSGSRRALIAAVAGLSASFGAHFVQEGIGRYRPNHSQTGREFAAPLAGFHGKVAAGFPSGEVATASAMAWLLGREFRRIRSMFVILAVATAVARCAFGMHYLSDVVFGAILGVSICIWVQHRALHIVRTMSRLRRRAATVSHSMTR